MLLIAFPETGKENFAHIGFAVTISALRVKNLRSGADDDSLAPGKDSGREI